MPSDEQLKDNHENSEGDLSVHNEEPKSKESSRESKKSKNIRKIHAKKVLAEQDANRARERKFKIRETEFLCQPKFRNQLPDIPFEPKFLDYPFPSDRLIRYNPTILEKKYRLKLNPEPDLGLALDMVDMEKFTVPKTMPELAPEDAILFVEEKVASKERKIRPNVTWLRRTEYLANDLFDAVHNFQSGKPHDMDSNMLSSLDFPKESIEDSFNAVSLEHLDVSHPTDESLHAVEILPLFPDANLFANRYQLAYFDLDPVSDLEGDNKERMAKSIIRNVDYSNTNSVVKTLCGSLIVPHDVQQETESLDFLRDYQFDTKELRQGQYLFIQKPNEKSVTLCNIEQRIELKKTKDRASSDRLRGANVTRTEYSEEEAAIRLKVLQNAGGRVPEREEEEAPPTKKSKVETPETSIPGQDNTEEKKEDAEVEKEGTVGKEEEGEEEEGEEEEGEESPPSSPENSGSASGSESSSSGSGSSSGSDSRKSDSED